MGKIGLMELEIIAAVIGVGFLCGFINTLAGSGSLLSLPLLMFLGLPANVANGTNRIAILMQNVVGVGSFYQQKVLNVKLGLRLGIPAVIGSFIGARIAVDLDDEIMAKIIGIIMFIMLIPIFLKPKQWLKGKEEELIPKNYIIQVVIFFFIGIYGGFIQAGVGIFLLTGLVLNVGLDLVKANAIKVFIVLLYTPIALAVFIFNGQVNYLYGFVLAIGNMGGAFIASRVAVSWGAKFVRWFLIVVIIFAATKLLFFL